MVVGMSMIVIVVVTMFVTMFMIVVMFVIVAMCMIVVMLVIVAMFMIVIMLVIVAVFMIVIMFVIVAVFMAVAVLMAVAVFMLMAVDMSGNGLRLHVRSVGMPAFGQMAAEQIFHVMVMIFMGGIQTHIEVTHVQTGLLHPVDGNGKSVHRQGAKRPLQSLPSRSQV